MYDCIHVDLPSQREQRRIVVLARPYYSCRVYGVKKQKTKGPCPINPILA